ncbi:MAG: polysaccharide biosynthesis/export protein [Pseudomonadota bacterium]|nr:polysaccharide biosynthesis/export protein [Pseudomonadota bacterium]
MGEDIDLITTPQQLNHGFVGCLNVKCKAVALYPKENTASLAKSNDKACTVKNGNAGGTAGGKMIRADFIKLVTVTLAIYLSGCASDIYIPTNSPLLKDQAGSGAINIYHIGVDDTVSINVWRNPELTVTVPVRPDGKISMPLIGDVVAAGFTPEEVAADISKQLQNFIRDPNVTLMVTGLQSHEYLTRLRVTGAVNTPSSLNYRQGMTVLDAILAAGSVNDFSAPNNTKLYRKIDGKTRVINIKLGDILYEGQLETNIELRPGDIITVPERLF